MFVKIQKKESEGCHTVNFGEFLYDDSSVTDAPDMQN